VKSLQDKNYIRRESGKRYEKWNVCFKVCNFLKRKKDLRRGLGSARAVQSAQPTI